VVSPFNSLAVRRLILQIACCLSGDHMTMMMIMSTG